MLFHVFDVCNVCLAELATYSLFAFIETTLEESLQQPEQHQDCSASGSIQPSATSCAILCTSFSSCVGFEYASRGNHCCYLKRGPANELSMRYKFEMDTYLMVAGNAIFFRAQLKYTGMYADCKQI